VNRQSAEIAQLRGNHPTAYACTPTVHPLLIDAFHFSFSLCALVSDLQSRIGELVEEQEQQTAALILAQKEKARLEAVEADLSKTVQTLRAEITSMKASHTADLTAMAVVGDELRAERDAAVAARDTMQQERDTLQADRDAQLAKCEALEKRHSEETSKMRRKAKGFCDAIAEIDNLLSGKSLLSVALVNDAALALAS
jgi:chromosome segregation ATPase